MMIKHLPLIAVLTLGGIAASPAQFAGDVYFETPSVAIAAGETGELEVVTFSGDRPLGAAHVVVNYDPARLEITAINAGDAEELSDTFVSKLNEGELSFITLNDTSLTDPFGTVSLARLEVRPLTTPGTRTNLAISVRNLLDQDSKRFVNFAGFNGEVVTTNGGAVNISSFATQAEEPSIPVGETERSALRRRAARMARPGQTVTVRHSVPASGESIPVTVTVPTLPSSESRDHR